jgi:hypothetical protein
VAIAKNHAQNPMPSQRNTVPPTQSLLAAKAAAAMSLTKDSATSNSSTNNNSGTSNYTNIVYNHRGNAPAIAANAHKKNAKLTADIVTHTPLGLYKSSRTLKPSPSTVPSTPTSIVGSRSGSTILKPSTDLYNRCGETSSKRSPRLPHGFDSQSSAYENDSNSLYSERTTSQSQSQSNVWNDINQSSSSLAMAAASSIAKSNPNSLVSSEMSPRMMKISNTDGPDQMLMSNTSLRNGSKHGTIMPKRPNVNHSSSNSSSYFKTQTSTDNGLSRPVRKSSSRKPPPPPRPSSSADGETHIASAYNPPIHRPYTASNVSVDNSEYSLYASAGYDTPHATRSSETDYEPAMNSSRQPQYATTTTNAPLSASQRLQNFFTPKDVLENQQQQQQQQQQQNYDGEQFNYAQNSQSTSVLPQRMKRLSVEEARLSSAAKLPFTAPTMPYTNTEEYPGDHHSTPPIPLSRAMSAIKSPLFEPNANSSNTNIYQQAIPKQQLVFRTTLRDGDKKSGFGRSKKNKDVFNEDKPWKHHERANLNVVTVDEKKRYQGVFAANKSLYIDLDVRLVKNGCVSESESETESENRNMCDDVNSSPRKTDTEPVVEVDGIPPEPKQLSDYVNTYSEIHERIHGIVVSEIWRRSMLDPDTLMKIWSLVLDDRKRRWIKDIASGNIGWLISEPNPEEDVSMGNGSDAEDPSADSAAGPRDDDDDDQVFDSSYSMHAIGIKGEVERDRTGYNDIRDPRASFYDDHMEKPSSSSAGSASGRSPLMANSSQLSVTASPKKPALSHSASSLRKKSEGNADDLAGTNRDEFDDGTLTCDEFIVGMWMIDQCLYGRKMPKIIPISVWETIGVDWTVYNDAHTQKQVKRKEKSKTKSGQYTHALDDQGIDSVSDIVGMGVKKKKEKKSKRGVFKKVIGM